MNSFAALPCSLPDKLTSCELRLQRAARAVSLKLNVLPAVVAGAGGRGSHRAELPMQESRDVIQPSVTTKRRIAAHQQRVDALVR
jgi:hypothetical protein